MTSKKIILAAFAALFLLGGGALLLRRSHGVHSGGAGAREIYYCPMHPDYTSDRPGDCPICGMHLVKKAAAAPEAAGGGRKIKFYRNPMNPAVTSKVPAKDDMGMDYVPVYEEQPGAAPAVEGRGEITLDAQKQQLIGIKTAVVSYRDLSRTITSSGRVAYDPDLYHAIAEYREALAAYDKIKSSSWPEAVSGARSMVDASRIKLSQLGIGQDQLAEIEKDPAAYDNLLLPGEKAWVYAQIYEYESADVKPGQAVTVTSKAYPALKFSGTVSSVDPILSAETRTLRARILTENPGLLLKPEMYVEAAIRTDYGRRLAVPSSAVLDTGSRELAFVVKGGGKFEPREVRTGARSEDYAEVVSGLKAGEKVVTSANFLVDSESRLKAGTDK